MARPDHEFEQLAAQNAALEARVAELSRRLQQVIAVSQLTAGIAHDFRNSLQIILGEAEALTQSLSEPHQLESANVMLQASSHAAAVSSELLSLAREQGPAAGSLDCDKVLAGCRILVERIVRFPVACVFTVEPGLWPVVAQQQQLQAALINLCINARDAMPEGGHLRVSARNLPAGTCSRGGIFQEDCVCFHVEDTGIGMTPEVLAHATEPYFTTKALAGGTGLGLAMAQEFATRAGGVLHIDSAPGRGTRIEIVLPRAAPPKQPGEDVQGALLGKIRSTVRASWLRDLLEAWSALRPARGLPLFAGLEAAAGAHAEKIIVLSFAPGEAPPPPRIAAIGDKLARALGWAMKGEPPVYGQALVERLGAIYARTLQTRFPSYEYTRYALEGHPPSELERLILPAASEEGKLSHLVGAVQLSTDFLQQD